MTFDIQSIQSVGTAWIISHGLRLLVIVVLSLVAYRFAGYFVERVVRKLVRRGEDSPSAEKKREDTLIGVLNKTVVVLVFIVALLTILSELGVAIGPILAAAGVAGLAFSFGGQYIIRDIISGLFILVENQYRVGDVVCFDSTCGSVEGITLRMTTIRDLDGTVHHIPHGEIKKVSNLTKRFARVNLDIGVSYDAKLEKVIEVVNETGEKLAQDPEWKEKIISAPKFLRVNEFADSAVMIKILGDTEPLEQWAVAGEFRKRIKIAFDEAGIEIPFPQRVIHTKDK